ncbi:MAG TPA: hypothetical protein VMY76_01185 [Gemmatimonadales bacterium]|nr:hypothetical protein [Gemmatimonadales bacterium]
MILAEAPRWRRAEWRCLAALAALAVALWLPRLRGPLDLRYDAGVYYILGTSLAEGRGYRLLNEPGAIEAIQYPPLLPAAGAAAELALGTDDPAVVGHWLRLGSVLLYAGYAAAVYGMSRRLLTPGYAFLVAAMSIIHSHTIFLSDFFAADVPYAFLTSTFFAVGAAPVTALLAVGAYGMRSAGIALLGTWVVEALRRRRPREIAIRGIVAAGVVLAWVGYTRQVKADPAYLQPAYAYQRAGYQFYNVSYAENMSYVDPFRPELGRVTGREVLDRLLTNVRGMPMTLGEGVSVHRGWWRGEVEKVNQRLPQAWVPTWAADAALYALCVPVLGGFVLLALWGEWLLLLYTVGSLGIIAITPWPIQFVRYLVPLTPFLTLALVSVLVWASAKAAAAHAWRWRVLQVVMIGVVGLIVAQQAITLGRSMTKHPTPAVYTDRLGARHDYRLFFYDRSWRLHDDGLDWLARQARPGEVVATSTPHWAYLRTGLPAIMPPYEADAALAGTLLDGVPVTYVVVDQLSFLDVGRRYTKPAIEREPDHWRLIYAVNDSGPRIYRRVGTSK